MQPISVPVADLTMKLIMGSLSAAFALVSLGFALRCLVIYIRVLIGLTPPKPGTKTIHLVLAPIAYLLLALPGVIAGAIFLGIMFTPPSVIAENGVTGGGGPVSHRQTIGWDEVERVDCTLSHSQKVTKIVVIAGDRRVNFSGTFNDLSYVRDAIWQRVPQDAIRPCRIPIG